MATLTIADLDNGKRDLETVDAVANSQADTTPTRYGQQTLTLAGALRRLGYATPVPYAPGLTMTSGLTTVERNGVIYAPRVEQLPFTTGAWDPGQWRVVQNAGGSKLVYQFPTLGAAQSAAPMLPDGSSIIVEGESQGHAAAGGYVPDSGTPAIRLQDYKALGAYSGSAAAADVTAAGIAGRFYRRGAAAENGATVIKDSSGRSWERDINAGDPIQASWFALGRTRAAIVAAIGIAKDGDTVRLEAGEYTISSAIDVPRSIAIEGATLHGTRGIQPTTVRWTGAAGGVVFKPAAWPPALGYVFSGISFDLGSGIALEIRAAFHVSVERCSFTREVYGDAIRMLESTPGASDGAFWTILERNTFTNCTVRVNADSNSTRISKCDFFSGSTPLAGPVISADNVDSLIIDECTMEGNVAVGQHLVLTDRVVGLSVTNSRLENYSGGSLYVSRPLGNFNTNGTFFNTPYVIGGDRNTVAHDVGVSVTDIGNTVFSRGAETSRFHEVANIGGVVSARNLFVFTDPSDTWYFQGAARNLVENGSLGLRSPVLRLYNPTAAFAGCSPTASFMAIPELALAADAGMYATAVFIVRASSGGTADSLVYVDTGAVGNELFHIPKDGKWHVMKVCKRLVPGDTKFTPTACLSYIATPGAGETLDIAGLGIFVGSGGFALPFFDAGSASPATNGNTKFFQRGEYLRNMSPGSPNPKGWLCKASGAPGTWQTD